MEVFEALNISVVAVAQEDKTLEEHAKLHTSFGATPPSFDIVADLAGTDPRVTTAYDRLTAYLIDERGIVRQIFPMTIQARPSWDIILLEAERVLSEG